MSPPTRPSDLLQWWRAAVEGGQPEVPHDPQSGWYLLRLVKDGPWVPIRIWCQQEVDDAGDLVYDEIMRAQIGDDVPFGGEAGPSGDRLEDLWPWAAQQPISAKRYQYEIDRARWARAHALDEPEANPRKVVDLNTLKPIY